MRQNAREVMMQGAALIVRIGSAMVVMAATLVDMVVMGVTGDARIGDIVCDVLLGCDGMLEMGTYQRHHSRDLGHDKQPQQPRTKKPRDTSKYHSNDSHPHVEKLTDHRGQVKKSEVSGKIMIANIPPSLR
jgi:hypothetical protein